MSRRYRRYGSDVVVSVDLKRDGDGWIAQVDDAVIRFRVEADSSGLDRVVTDDGRQTPFCVETTATGKLRQVFLDGTIYDMESVRRSSTRAASEDTGGLDAPMPGKVLQVRVDVGDEVTSGQVLMVVEAMKMEHAIKAPRDGVVARVGFSEGAQVALGDRLVELK
jgi:biotin carboxyl carrier protein